MKDQKLHTFRRAPDDIYADNLYQRLTILPQAKTAPPQLPKSGRYQRRRLAWAFAMLLAGFLVMAIVPGVRARFEDVIKKVGSLTIFMTEDYPGKYEPRIVPDDIMTLEEARGQVDFEFNLPAWVPEGLTIQDNEVRVSSVVDGLIINWVDQSENGRAFNIVINRANPDVPYIVGPDSMTEITLNGEPAAFIRGGWYSDSKEWRDDGIRSIRLQLNGIQYHLSAGSEAGGGITDEELIKIAESISATEPEEAGSRFSP